MKSVQKPMKLCSGDKVAAISLSWGGASVFPERYALAKMRAKERLGLELVETRHALREPTWLAANPEARANDLMEAFSDASIKGIFSIIGGEDSVRLEPFMDYSVLASNPKVFMGYSDTTVSHFMCLKAGLSSFYGPSLLAEFAENVQVFPYTMNAVKRVLFSDAPVGVWQPEVNEWSGQMLSWAVSDNAKIKRQRQKPLGPRLLQGEGCVEGPLIGGCIEVLEMLRATPLWPDLDVWQGSILFLETSEERPSVDLFRRWVRGYASMGILQRVRAVLFGRPMSDFNPEEMTQYDKVLQSIVRDELGLDQLPLMTQLDFGHSDPKFVLPIGQRLILNCEAQTLTLPEAAVV